MNDEIARCVAHAYGRLEAFEFEGAFRDICGAVEGTIKKSGTGGPKAYKARIDANLDLILAVSLGGLRTAKLHVAYTKLEKEGLAPTLAEIVYHAMRCEVAHAGGLPDDIDFFDSAMAGQTLSAAACRFR